MGRRCWPAPSEVTPEQLAQVQAGARPDDAINIQYTSGTTGFPKGATLTHRNILNNGYFVGELCRYTEADRVCIPVPFYHCFGMVMGNLACTTHGAAMVIPAPGFDPAATLKATARTRSAPRSTACRRCSSPSGRCPTSPTTTCPRCAPGSWPARRARHDDEEAHRRRASTEVTICYGMTETSPVSTQTRTDDTFEQKVGTVGRVGPHLEIKVVDPVTGETLPRGEAGRVLHQGLLGDARLLGAAGQDRRGARVDGWMHTGDIAVMDDDGYVQITGRIKDMVIRGGENVYPREIEEFLYTHPDILDAQVIGVPGREVRRGAVRLDPDARRAPSRSTPTRCGRSPPASSRTTRSRATSQIVDEFPMTVTGKVRKVEMREKTVADLGLAAQS